LRSYEIRFISALDDFDYCADLSKPRLIRCKSGVAREESDALKQNKRGGDDGALGRQKFQGFF